MQYPSNNQPPWQPQSRQWQQPPIPPFQAPQPPPPRKKRRRLWLVVIIAAIVLCGIVGKAIASTPSQQTAASTATVPTAKPTTKPTDIPTAKPTPKPAQGVTNATITHGTPLLGGPLSDFIGKYGQPNNHTDVTSSHWFRDSSSNVDGLIVSTLTHPHQVDSIDVAALNGDMPNLSAAEALCTVYNPSDAHELKRIPLVDASGRASGFDVIYVSNSLAQKFAASDFTDANGNTIQRGSFDIQYLYKGDGTQNIDSCSILPGEQQTHL